MCNFTTQFLPSVLLAPDDILLYSATVFPIRTTVDAIRPVSTVSISADENPFALCVISESNDKHEVRKEKRTGSRKKNIGKAENQCVVWQFERALLFNLHTYLNRSI